jgi:hypothetical protein
MSSQQDFKPDFKSNNSSQSCLDPLDSLLDFSEYETVSYHQSPSMSPSASSKQQFSRPVSNTPATLPPSSQQQFSGPSHQYDAYRQTTGIPQGAIASTLAVNQSNVHINQYGYSNEYLGLSSNDDFVDFGSAPRRAPSFPDMDMDFDSPESEPTFFYPEQASEFVNPSALNENLPAANVVPTQTSNVGRLWPGMHQQQAALAKAQAQQKQQQQIIQQQRQNAMGAQPRQQTQRPRSHQPVDPIVEEKISQLLHSMRHNSEGTDGDDAHTPNNLAHVQRMRKEEEDMDEDERLLASEEGKKLSSKERRQLRNKVSARAFRSRRKEYIGQLEGEIATKVNENTDLRNQNRALMEENTRLSDLTRMLLSSPSFSGFLDTLSANPAAVQPAPAAVQQHQPQVEKRQVRKDVNPYAAQQQMQQQQIGMAMIPEATMDFSMLDLNLDGGYSYQPQVFSVLSLPETVIDSSILSGKKSEKFTSEQKVDYPVIRRMPVKEEAPVVATPIVDEEFDSDPAFALFTNCPAPSSSPLTLADLDFSGIVCEKSRFTLVTVNESDAISAMDRVQRLCESIDAAAERLEALTLDL